MKNTLTTAKVLQKDTSSSQQQMYDLLRSRMRLPHVAGRSRKERLLEVAQQKCLLNDHTAPSRAEAEIILQDPQALRFCALMLFYHDMTLIES